MHSNRASQFADVQIASQLHPGFDVHSKAADHFDLGQGGLQRLTKRDDAVGGKAAARDLVSQTP